MARLPYKDAPAKPRSGPANVVGVGPERQVKDQAGTVPQNFSNPRKFPLRKNEKVCYHTNKSSYREIPVEAPDYS
jgi:hypothetical protein